MKLPIPHTTIRRFALFSWLPLTCAVFIALGFAITKSNHSAAIPSITSGSSGGLFAAAPPKSQVLGDSIIANRDARTVIIASYLRDHGSPMVGSAGTFVTVADKYDLDWRLLVAVAGKESTFGLHVPKGSYNAWGWGIPTGAQSGKSFSSWNDGINTVGKGLREKYYNRGLTTLAAIEAIYTPPSAANPDHPWRNGVAQFMYELEHYQ
jgi:hypothetical protein